MTTERFINRKEMIQEGICGWESAYAEGQLYYTQTSDCVGGQYPLTIKCT